MNKILFILLGAGLLFHSCNVTIPTNCKMATDSLMVYPNYQSVTVPMNIAPLNFFVANEADDVIVAVTGSDDEQLLVSAGSDKKVRFPLKRWKEFLNSHKDDSLNVDVYVKRNDWLKYPTFKLYVVSDSIDPFVTFRLIEPSYMSTGKYGLYEHSLETAERTTFVSNRQFKQDPSHKGQMCMNCHTKQLNHQENSIFHYRVQGGGMVMTYNGKTQIVATKVGDMLMPAIYSQWHPSLPFITFSNNSMHQFFPSKNPNKIEPMDERSDILLYDVEKNEVSYVFKTRGKCETYSTWSPDGRYMYYCSSDSILSGNSNNYKQLKFDLMRVEFFPETVTWGTPEVVFQASAQGKSVAKPRVSPDGRFVIMTISEYGAYHFTHHDADIYIYDLNAKSGRLLDEVNTPQAECYTMFSSNGRWILFSSRIEDGNYVRLYFSHIDENGKASRPFQLPSEDPLYDKDLLQNYNYPEFGMQAVTITPNDIYSLIDDNHPLIPSYRGDMSEKTDGNSGASVMYR